MNVSRLRAQFPALRKRRRQPGLTYLDSACMSLVPTPVLKAMEEYYRDYPGCAGRSLHRYAAEVTHRYEQAREVFAGFLGMHDPASIVFLRNATEAMNLVGQGLRWRRGDRVLISDQEHNSNLVLWQRLARERGIRVDVLPLADDGSFDGDLLENRLHRGIRLVSLFHTSNLDGRSIPVREVTERSHDRGALVMFDGCQSAPHEKVDLEAIGADFFALSGHKMLGPTGTGVLAGGVELLKELRPLVLGGETVEWTTLTDHELRPPPHRFEAGLQNYAGVLGAAEAVRFLQRVGLDEVHDHQRRLNERVTEALSDTPRVRVLGPPLASDRPSIYAFHIDGIDPNDAALFLDEGYRVLVRSGMHCVHSWYARRNLPGNVRASFYLYNTEHDADQLVRGVEELLERIPLAKHPGKKRSGSRLATATAA